MQTGTMCPVSSLKVRRMSWSWYRHPTLRPLLARLVSTRNFWFCNSCQQSLQGAWILCQGANGQRPLDWLGGFCQSLRKEVPPDVFITVANLFGTAMKIDKHGKSRFQFLCAKISHFPVDNGLGMPYYPVKIRAIQGHSEAALKNRRGSLCQFNHGVLLKPSIPRAKSRLHWRAPVCHDWGPWGCLPSHDEKQLEEHRTERPDPRWRWHSQQWPCSYLHGRTTVSAHRGIDLD